MSHMSEPELHSGDLCTQTSRALLVKPNSPHFDESKAWGVKRTCKPEIVSWISSQLFNIACSAQQSRFGNNWQ